MRAALPIILILALALGGLSACAKKEVDSSSETISTAPSGTSKTAQDEAARKQAEDEAYRQRQLEEERQRQAAAEAERMKSAAYAEAKQEVANMIHFDFDSYELKPEARQVLQAKADQLKKFPGMKLVIEGYCDDRGTEEYNLALGERRARAAYEFLVLLGVDPSRMSIVSYGEENPIDPAQNEVAWAKNRRDEFEIIQ